VQQPPVPFTWLLALALMPPSADRAAAVVPSPHVRAVSVPTRMLIDDAARRSVVVRELLARIGCTDAIVYVEITASPQIPRARTKLVASIPGARFLRIGINAAIAFPDLVPLLAHELQHAVEIAERDEVRDEAAVRRLYHQIGRAGGVDTFETDAALAVELSVRIELRHRIARGQTRVKQETDLRLTPV
jgi:hypothetical protein